MMTMKKSDPTAALDPAFLVAGFELDFEGADRVFDAMGLVFIIRLAVMF